MKKSVLIVTIILISFFARSSRLVAAQKVKIATPVREAPLYFLPTLAAMEKGFWKQEGLEADWVSISGATPLSQAMVAGSIKISLGMGSNVLQMASRGIPVIIVADLEGLYNWHLYVREDSPIKTPDDLKGRSVGVGRFGSLADIYVRVMLKRLGLEKDVKIIALGGVPQYMAGLQARLVDAIMSADQTIMKLELAGTVRRIAPLADHIPKEWNSMSIFVVKDLIRTDPGLVMGAVRGTLKAVDFVMKNSQWAINAIRQEMGTSDPVARKIYEVIHYSYDGAIRPDRLSKLRNFMIEYDLLQKDRTPSIRELYSDRFVPVR